MRGIKIACRERNAYCVRRLIGSRQQAQLGKQITILTVVIVVNELETGVSLMVSVKPFDINLP
jgi:hypothetical protein